MCSSLKNQYPDNKFDLKKTIIEGKNFKVVQKIHNSLINAYRELNSYSANKNSNMNAVSPKMIPTNRRLPNI